MIDEIEYEELARQSRKTRRNEAAENRRAFDPDRDPEPWEENEEENDPR